LSLRHILLVFFSFFFTATPPTEIYTLSLHDALPILNPAVGGMPPSESMNISIANAASGCRKLRPLKSFSSSPTTSRRRMRTMTRSEEHTSELQSPYDLVCRLLLEKKKKKKNKKKKII